MSRSLSINLDLRPFSIAIYGKLDLYYLCLFRLFSGLQIMSLNLDHLRFIASFDIGDYLGYWEGSASVLSYFFSCFFLVCKFYKSGLYVITYFEYAQRLILEFLVFNFLVFSVFKYLKSTFLAIFRDLEMLQFWCVNYIWQVCKLQIYLGYIWKFGQYLYLSVLSKQWKFPNFSFCLSICCIAILLKSVFLCTFWRLKVIVLGRKIVQNLLIFVYLFCPKNRTIDLTKSFITQEWLVVESCPTPRWIAFLMLYRWSNALISMN